MKVSKISKVIKLEFLRLNFYHSGSDSTVCVLHTANIKNKIILKPKLFSISPDEEYFNEFIWMIHNYHSVFILWIISFFNLLKICNIRLTRSCKNSTEFPCTLDLALPGGILHNHRLYQIQQVDINTVLTELQTLFKLFL